jgi:hypothetical protein
MRVEEKRYRRYREISGELQRKEGQITELGQTQFSNFLDATALLVLEARIEQPGMLTQIGIVLGLCSPTVGASLPEPLRKPEETLAKSGKSPLRYGHRVLLLLVK